MNPAKPRIACALMVACALTVVRPSAARAQGATAPSADLPPHALALNDLSAFQPPTGSWKIVGGVSGSAPHSSALATSPGVGVVVNRSSPSFPSTLSTTWTHGDIDLSFDVMTSSGSKASVLLMGRYGVNLSDSWTNGATGLSMIGAITPIRSARESELDAFEGTPPRQNASRAPGLWQHVEILFRAPRFAAGEMISSARFLKVSVNGVLVQEHVQVAEPARGVMDRGASSAAPLTFAGGRGGFAVRNIRYKTYDNVVSLSGLRYRIHEADAMDASYAANHAPTREGSAGAISPDLALPQDKFAVRYDGTFTAPTPGTYRFGLFLGWIGNDLAARGVSIGGGMLSVDGRPVITHKGVERRVTGDVDLTAGSHAFAVSYYKNRPQFNRRDVAITVEGPGVERRLLSEEGGVGSSVNAPVNPIMVDAQAEPVLLRSFVRHRNTKRVIAISVADPRDVHYTYDLAQGALLYVWRGPFLETTPMWHERGEDQTAEPMGSAITLPGTPSVAHLASASAPWPDSVDDRALRRDGYQLDKSGHPTFLYRVDGVSVEDAVRADADGRSLHRELRLSARPGSASTSGFYVQLAQGEHIVRQADGSYVVGDAAYYIRVPANSSRPIVRRVNGADELLVPVSFGRGHASVSYSIVW